MNTPKKNRLLVNLLVIVMVLAGLSRLSAQDATPASPSPAAATSSAPDTTNPAASSAPGATKSLWQMITEGGLVMIPIGALSIATVYLIIDGSIRTGRKKLAPLEHVKRIQNLFQQGDYVGAYQYCKKNRSALTNVLRVGISLLGEGKQIAEEGMLSELAKENSHLQTWISYLSVIGVCSPMIGLLGTVTGMIRAFATLGSSGIGDPSSLSSAIGEVLTATASGLFIAIPAFVSYYIFRNRTQQVIVYADDKVSRLLEDIPYEDLGGLRIGESFNAGASDLVGDAEESRRVSMALSTNCPVCNGAVTPGENPCPHCGASLDWAA
jgi:biopolymer transport protein ExbB